MEKKLPIETERFVEIRKANRYTQTEFAEILGIKNSTADIERGKTKLPGRVVSELMKQFQINPLWLYGESDVQFLNSTKKEVLPKVITVNSSQNENILMVNQKAAAGYPQNVQDVEWHKQLPAFDMPLPEFRNATYRGFQIEGDSMLPNFRPGEWVLGKAVPSLDEMNNGKVHIVVLRDSVLVKKLRKLSGQSKLQLISLNENYPSFEVGFEEIQELWQVNSKLTFSIDAAASDTGILRELQQSMDELKTQMNAFKNKKSHSVE